MLEITASIYDHIWSVAKSLTMISSWIYIYIYILIELSKLQLGVAVGVNLMVTTMAITFMSWDMRPVQQVFFATSKRIWTYFRSSSMVGPFSYWEWVGGWPSIRKSLGAPKSSKNYQDSCWSLFTWIVFKTPFCWWLSAIRMLQYIYIYRGILILNQPVYIVEWQMLNMLTWVFTNSKSLIWWENVALISIHLRIKDRPLGGNFGAIEPPWAVWSCWWRWALLLVMGVYCPVLI